jgi:hypothetical protein
MKEYYFNIARRRKNPDGTPANTFNGQPAYEFFFRTEWMSGNWKEVGAELVKRFPPLEYQVARCERLTEQRWTDL